MTTSDMHHRPFEGRHLVENFLQFLIVYIYLFILVYIYIYLFFIFFYLYLFIHLFILVYIYFIYKLYPTPHFVPEGISSSLRDFIVIVFNIEVFQIKFS